MTPPNIRPDETMTLILKGSTIILACVAMARVLMEVTMREDVARVLAYGAAAEDINAAVDKFMASRG